MRTLTLTVVILACCGMQAATHFYTGNQLIARCTDNNPATRNLNLTACVSYIVGVVDEHVLYAEQIKLERTFHLMVPFCPPDGVTQGQIAKVFVQWANAHPEKLHESAARLAHLALSEAWPCK